MIPVRSESELDCLREAGSILAGILKQLSAAVRPGVTTQELDDLASLLMRRAGVRSAFKGYRGYPAHICACVNEEIVHGIPGPRVLQEGDLFKLDTGIEHKGYFSDSAVTVGVGKISQAARSLLQVTREALQLGIKQARPENRLFDIAHAVQSHVERNGFSVVRQFVGHGIGKNLHEEPEIPNFGRPHEGAHLREGMVLAIEPMVNRGGWEAEVLENGWTAVTKDGSLSAHFEHTVAVTAQGPQVLTA